MTARVALSYSLLRMDSRGPGVTAGHGPELRRETSYRQNTYARIIQAPNRPNRGCPIVPTL